MMQFGNKVQAACAADHDIIYATTQGPPPTATLPPVLDKASSTETTKLASHEFVRRGQRVGDIGWGCFTINPRESADHGLRDGHAALSMDLHKRNQFLQLPGDPCFDKRSGKYLATKIRQPPRKIK